MHVPVLQTVVDVEQNFENLVSQIVDRPALQSSTNPVEKIVDMHPLPQPVEHEEQDLENLVAQI
eukprot:4272949-Amphidinium_carterae.1